MLRPLCWQTFPPSCHAFQLSCCCRLLIAQFAGHLKDNADGVMMMMMMMMICNPLVIAKNTHRGHSSCWLYGWNCNSCQHRGFRQGVAGPSCGYLCSESHEEPLQGFLVVWGCNWICAIVSRWMEMLLVPWFQIVLAREIIPAWVAKICKRCSSLTPRWWHLCFSSPFRWPHQGLGPACCRCWTPRSSRKRLRSWTREKR